jgi:hypothetical protein
LRGDKKMAVIKELIREENDGTIGFGDYSLNEKAKKDGFSHDGDSYKIKTFKDITKLEKNEMFVYESVPGTCVEHFNVKENEVTFDVSSSDDAEITLGLEPETEYEIIKDNIPSGTMNTNLGGKLTFSVEINGEKEVSIKVIKK